MYMRHPRTQHGFTLIEMIVSLGVFSIVATIAVGALLVLIGTNRQLQGEQSIMTNLSFALDSMTREIRTGTHYYCDSAANYSAGGPNNIFDGGNDLDALLTDVSARQRNQNCDGTPPGGHELVGIAFIEGGDSITGSDGRILYFYDEEDGKIYRRIGTEVAESIVSSGLFIRDFKIVVTGSDPLSTGGGTSERDQAAVTFYIEAAESSNPAAKSYRIQTTITQRTLDI